METDKLMEGYAEFKSTLNKHELAYFGKEFIKEKHIKKEVSNYKDMDIWLFEKWKKTQLTKNEKNQILSGVNHRSELE